MTGVRLRKDLSGAITQEVMRKLKADQFMDQYKDTLNVFGRCIAQYVLNDFSFIFLHYHLLLYSYTLLCRYVVAYLEQGTQNADVLSAGFDIDMWNRRKTKNAKRITPQEKETLVSHIVQVRYPLRSSVPTSFTHTILPFYVCCCCVTCFC